MDQIRSSIVWDISMQADRYIVCQMHQSNIYTIMIPGCEEIKIRDGFTENNYKN